MSKKLLLNSLSGTTHYAVSVVVAFIMSPVYIKALGNRDYGLWELVMSVIGYMGLLDLGVGPALVRFVSIADGKQDRDDLRQTISTSFAFFVVVGSVSVLIFFALGYSPGMIAGSETKDIANLGTVFMLLGINAGMLFPLQVFIATLMGVQRHYIVNSVRIMMLIPRAGLTYYLLLHYQGRGLIIMALLEPIFTAITFLIFSGAVYFDETIPNMSFLAITRSKAKEMLTFGVKSATMMIASRLQNQSVPLIIGNVLGLGQIVYFVLPNRLVDYAKGVSQAIGFPLTPYFGAAVGRGNHGELVKSWLNTTLAIQIVSLAMPVVIFFCGETFLGLWIGQEYSVAGRMVLYILMAGLVADSLAGNSFRILTAQGKHGKIAMIWLVLSVISILLGIWWAHLWGVAGVAAGTTISIVIANMLTVIMACLTMKVSLVTYISKCILPLMLPLLLLMVTMWGACRIFPAKSYIDLILVLITAGSVYITAVWFFTLEADVRQKLKERARLAFI